MAVDKSIKLEMENGFPKSNSKNMDSQVLVLVFHVAGNGTNCVIDYGPLGGKATNTNE